MGPVITAQHRDRVLEVWSRAARKKGAKIIADGRGVKVAEAPNGFYLGATIVDQVRNEMTLAREEVFGPVLNVMRMEDLDARHRDREQIRLRKWRRDLHQLRKSRARVQASRQGGHGRHQRRRARRRMAMFPFTGWDDSFYGDLHMQGKEGVQFYTQQKVVTHPLVRRRRGGCLEEVRK